MLGTHQRSRQGLGRLLVLVAGALAFTLGCPRSGLDRGVWLTAEGPERWALTFEKTGRLVTGTMSLLREGKRVAQWGVAGTRRGADGLELSWPFNNSLSLKVDLERGELRGTAVLSNDSVHDALFVRVVPADIPGFAPLPELPYRLHPPAPGSGWEVASPEEVGIDSGQLEATVRALIRGEAGLMHSLVVVRHGKLVAEEYFYGYSREDLHEVHSVTKSITSLVVGIARDRGRIGSLDEPVLAWFPKYAATAGTGWQNVTLRHLMTMTSGLDWDAEEAIEGPPVGPGLFEMAFRRQVAHEPGSRFLYNNHDVELLAGVLRRSTGMHADEFAQKTLFASLGVTDWDWELGRTEGFPSLGGTLRLRPLDLAKIGQMVLDGGRWRDEQVVSKEWIAESTAPIVSTHREADMYGLLWWRFDAPLEAERYPVIVASGWASQFIHVVPALDAVIVNTGGNIGGSKMFAIGDVLLRHLAPGVERSAHASRGRDLISEASEQRR